MRGLWREKQGVGSSQCEVRREFLCVGIKGSAEGLGIQHLGRGLSVRRRGGGEEKALGDGHKKRLSRRQCVATNSCLHGDWCYGRPGPRPTETSFHKEKRQRTLGTSGHLR